MRQFVNAANLATSGNLVMGFLAVMLAADGRLELAAVTVVVAAALDGVDGLVARRLGICGRFGCQLDSLADLVAFGVAPALMLQRGPLHSAPILGGGACMAFVLAGAWRLARFPLVEDRHHFVGLPIPAAGLLAAAAALASPAGLAVGVTLGLAALMVSAMPFPTLLTVVGLLRGRLPISGAEWRRGVPRGDRSRLPPARNAAGRLAPRARTGRLARPMRPSATVTTTSRRERHPRVASLVRRLRKTRRGKAR